MAVQSNPSRLGQNQLAGDANALFLKVFSGEIISSFEENNLLMPLHRVRTIASGKSAQFPVTGVAGAKYHTPGESLLSTGATTGYGATTSGGTTTTVPFDGGANKYLNKFAHSERVISIDDVLVSSTFVADIDEMKNHYDVRSIYSTEIGRALAYTADKNIIHTVIAGARVSTDRFGGSSATYLGDQLEVGTMSAEAMIAVLFAAAQQMDEKNVPMDGRYCILNPATYYLLAKGDSGKIGIAINKDYGGAGSFAAGTVMEVAGIKILKSNHIPSANLAGTIHDDAGILNNPFGGSSGYAANFATTKGIVFQTEAVGTVKLMDLSVESEYITERLGTLMLAKYAMGHGILREECCYEIIDA